MNRPALPRNTEALLTHFNGVGEDDLLVIAFHNGKSHSVTLPGGDWFDLDDQLAFELRDLALSGEARDLHINSGAVS